MRHWAQVQRRKARTLRVNQAKVRVERVESLADAYMVKRKEQVASSKRSFKEFCEQVYGFTPYKYQLDLADLFENNQFLLAAKLF